ncbi:MAG TPA: DUF2085 domain-containing protein [Thermomicrobiales bacterium]|nr:DUF2085 domain-containing protein [Thermomicrobiales bacterium]
MNEPLAAGRLVEAAPADEAARTAQVLQSLQARQGVDPAPAAPALSPRMRAFVQSVDRAVLAVARHWLLAVNLISGVFAVLPVLAPWLLARGVAFPANAIYFLYHFTCHQLPSRSFFIFGHQLAYCERDTAIYSGFFLLGLAYALVKGRIRPLAWRWLFLLWVPMALDGFTQLFGWRESTWELRVVTGALFALSCVWFGFPYLEQGFRDIRTQLEARFARVAA